MSQLDVGVEEHIEATKLMTSLSKLIRLIDVDIFMIMNHDVTRHVLGLPQTFSFCRSNQDLDIKDASDSLKF